MLLPRAGRLLGGGRPHPGGEVFPLYRCRQPPPAAMPPDEHPRPTFQSPVPEKPRPIWEELGLRGRWDRLHPARLYSRLTELAEDLGQTVEELAQDFGLTVEEVAERTGLPWPEPPEPEDDDFPPHEEDAYPPLVGERLQDALRKLFNLPPEEPLPLKPKPPDEPAGPAPCPACGHPLALVPGPAGPYFPCGCSLPLVLVPGPSPFLFNHESGPEPYFAPRRVPTLLLQPQKPYSPGTAPEEDGGRPPVEAEDPNYRTPAGDTRDWDKVPGSTSKWRQAKVKVKPAKARTGAKVKPDGLDPQKCYGWNNALECQADDLLREQEEQGPGPVARRQPDQLEQALSYRFQDTECPLQDIAARMGFAPGSGRLSQILKENEAGRPLEVGLVRDFGAALGGVPGRRDELLRGGCPPKEAEIGAALCSEPDLAAWTDEALACHFDCSDKTVRRAMSRWAPLLGPRVPPGQDYAPPAQPRLSQQPHENANLLCLKDNWFRVDRPGRLVFRVEMAEDVEKPGKVKYTGLGGPGRAREPRPAGKGPSLVCPGFCPRCLSVGPKRWDGEEPGVYQWRCDLRDKPLPGGRMVDVGGTVRIDRWLEGGEPPRRVYVHTDNERYFNKVPLVKVRFYAGGPPTRCPACGDYLYPTRDIGLGYYWTPETGVVDWAAKVERKNTSVDGKSS